MKTKDIKVLTIEELKNKLKEKKEQLFKKKFQHSTSSLNNPLEIRNLRRDVAKILTILKEKNKQ